MGGEKVRNIISCRPGCYDLPLQESMKLLGQLGIEGVEVNVPQGEDYGALADMAKEAGVRITSLSTGVNLLDGGRVAKLERAIEGARGIGTGVIFVSASVKEGKPEQGIPVLRGLGDRAKAAGVVLSLETHPPYCANGDNARRTIESIGSAGVRCNFDTANIYYYNPKGISTVEELKKALPYVASVHLKESAKGEPKSMDFPVLGTGIVDFPEVFRLLGGRGFRGPYTLELEGPLVDGLPVEQRTEKVRACLDYLKRIGAM